MRRTGEATTTSTRSASGASQSAVARIWSLPSSLSPGFALASPPEKRFSTVCGGDAVADQDQRRRACPPRRTSHASALHARCGHRRGLRGRSRSPRSASRRSGSSPATVTPCRLPSSASLASRSACWFCSRGIQVYVVSGARELWACAASGLTHVGVLDLPAPRHLLDHELGVHPDLDRGARGELASEPEPGDRGRSTRPRCWWRPRSCRASSAMSSPVVGVLEQRAVAGRPGVAAGTAVRLDDDRGVTHSPDSEVRTRMRVHSSQRTTRSLGMPCG